MEIFKTVQSLTEICDLQAKRLKKALFHLNHLIPFKSTQLSSLSDNELSYLDMLSTRFAKLQDLLGAKIFPTLLRLMQEYDDKDSGLDRLHKLEKLGILPSAQEWITMRELRNYVTHDYPDDPELMANNLNKIVQYANTILPFWEAIKIKINNITKDAQNG